MFMVTCKSKADSSVEDSSSVSGVSLSSRMRLWLRCTLFGLIAVELGLFAMLQTMGWDRTGQTLHLWIAGLVVGLPLLVVATIMLWNRFRFGTRSLLVFMLCTAVFLWQSAIPYGRFRDSRTGTLLLRDARISFSVNANLRFGSLKRYLDPPWPKHSVARDISVPPFWLSPFVSELSRIPDARSIQEIDLRSDSELQFFLQHHQHFEGLQVLSITDPSDESLAQLEQVLTKHDLLTEIICHSSSGEFPPGLWRLMKSHRVPMLGLSVPLSSSKPFLPDDLPTWDALRVLCISTDRNIALGTTQFQDTDAEILSRCDQLRYFESFGLRPKSLRGLEKHLPDCEVHVH